MKLIKQNGIEFEPYYRTLPNLADSSEYKPREFTDTYKLGSLLNSYSHFLESLHQLDFDLAAIDSLEEFNTVLAKGLKKVINLKEAEIYMYQSGKLLPIIEDEVSELWLVLKQIEGNGLLNAIFNAGEPTLVPEMNDFAKESSRLNYLVYPIFENKKRKGLLILQTAISSFSRRSLEAKFIKIIVSRFITKLEVLERKNEIKETYKELQAYQSKFRNEYKLSAIGELTSEIVENILEPLQAIVSSADLLKSDDANSDSDLIRVIQNKAKLIETSVKRISRYSAKNNDKQDYSSCDLNAIIKEFFVIVESSFLRKNYESFLDLADNLPPVLSNTEYIKQILTNVFMLLNSSLGEAGGIWLQTRHEKDQVLLRIFSSDYIDFLSQAEKTKTDNNYLKIISSLLKKHSGKIFYDSQKNNGTSISLSFPLRRQ